MDREIPRSLLQALKLRVKVPAAKGMSAHFCRESEMGSGTYGVVYSARSPSGRRSAIKYNLKSTPWDFVSCLRELNINHQLSLHPHVIPLARITEGEPFENRTRLSLERGTTRDKIHFVYPLAESNLETFLCNRRDTTLSEIRTYITEILLAVEYMHGMGFIHRDLKPVNILVMREGDTYHCRVGDFGLAKPYNTHGSHTPGTMTSWFRAPEMVLGSRKYDKRADMWSVGCIVYEMISGIPLTTTTSNDNLEILKAVVAVLPYQVPETTAREMDKIGYYGSINWRRSPISPTRFLNLRDGTDVFDGCGGQALFWDFLMGLLSFHPGQRSTATVALNHEWLRPCRGCIDRVRTQFPPQERSYPPVKVIDCEARNWAMTMVMEVWNHRYHYGWYNDRVLFHSIAVMDRALVVEPTTLDETGFNKKKVELLYLTVLYATIKYFSTLQTAIPFSAVAGPDYCTPPLMRTVEKYESRLLANVLYYDFFHLSTYDLLCRDKVPEEIEVHALLLFLINGHHADSTPYEAYSFWQRHRNYYLEASERETRLGGTQRSVTR